VPPFGSVEATCHTADATRRWPTTLLAFGNPSLPAGSGLRMVYGDAPLLPLPDAEREVDTLRRMDGAAGAKVYVGAAAREERFKAAQQ